MKSIQLLFAILFTGIFLNSCTTVINDPFVEIVEEVSLEEVVSGYDLWYVDYHRTTGSGDIPFLAKAFTVSFINGIMYANNNIVDIGRTGNGLGIDVGSYNTFNGSLETIHDIDGFHNFDITVLSNNEIRIYNRRANVNYFLIGYQVNEFDYDRLFYENIEYFLQEFVAWEKVTTQGGIANVFDLENFLAFTPENNTTFYSSQDDFGTQVDLLRWSYIGDYEVFDVAGFEDVKILTLYYEGEDIEEFELTVINDDNIQLFNTNSQTTYNFIGRGFVQFLKGTKTKKNTKDIVRNENRKRTKIKRQVKQRRNLK